MTIRDFLQTPPNKLQGVYINARKECQQVLNGSLWKIFLKLFELIEMLYVMLMIRNFEKFFFAYKKQSTMMMIL